MDPIVAGGLAAAKAAAADPEAKKTTWSLVGRVLGPAADEYGAHLAERVAAWRVRNAERIAEKAAEKATGRDGVVPPRVAYKILDDGTLTDDDVAVEYLSGMLAGSRTPSGKDDRALVWSDLVSRMSSIQVRAHYLLYREWALGLPDGGVIDLGMTEGRRRAEMHTPLIDFGVALGVHGDEIETLDELLNIVSHAITGLLRNDLLDDEYRFGYRANESDSPFEHYLRVYPSVAGLELYAAAAASMVLPRKWPDARLAIEADPPVPRLPSVAFPRLASPEAR